ncbi:spore germination protein [Neobacillus cucumis]|uniref:spore germination protein n=1 Tax=Neobacillus cucumis TaxID=1740721 RepID=UPI001E527769|nr:spore germination protein [Neobacillus cucumis]
MSSVLRIIRLLAVSFSILVTPIYVAFLSYHYVLIPKDLMVTLVSSRRVMTLFHLCRDFSIYRLRYIF